MGKVVQVARGGLALAAFAMTLLGGIGERYAAVAQATLILAIYTAIGLEHHAGMAGGFWQEPLLLIGGAAWYGLLGILWSALFSQQPVQQALARVFEELGAYLRLKASLFEPVRKIDIEARRLELARQNGRVVTALNQAKDIILNRMSRLTDMQAPVELKFGAGDGMMTLRATPTSVSSGTPDTTYGTLSRFGGGPATALRPKMMPMVGTRLGSSRPTRSPGSVRRSIWRPSISAILSRSL